MNKPNTYTPKELLHDGLLIIVLLALICTGAQNVHLKQHNKQLQEQTNQQQEQLDEIMLTINTLLGDRYDE